MKQNRMAVEDLFAGVNDPQTLQDSTNTAFSVSPTAALTL